MLSWGVYEVHVIITPATARSAPDTTCYCTAAESLYYVIFCCPSALLILFWVNFGVYASCWQSLHVFLVCCQEFQFTHERNPTNRLVGADECPNNGERNALDLSLAASTPRRGKKGRIGRAALTRNHTVYRRII
jgi:hypothetical protein